MSSSAPSPHTIALILAAGSSTRMGTCKAALPWQKDQSLLSFQIRQWLEVGVTPRVVLGPHNAQLGQECPPETQVVINPDPNRGKTSSILLGLEAIAPPVMSLFISAVDQPRPAAVYAALQEAYQQHHALITAPSWGGRLGHPLLFDHRLLPHLKGISEATLGLRQVIHQFQPAIYRVAWTSAVVLSDLNTPEQYTQAIAQTAWTTPTKP